MHAAIPKPLGQRLYCKPKAPFCERDMFGQMPAAGVRTGLARSGGGTGGPPTILCEFRDGFGDAPKPTSFKHEKKSRPLPKHLRLASNLVESRRPQSAANNKPQRSASSLDATLDPAADRGHSRPLSAAPPLAATLERAGMSHYTRKLCDELSCATIGQILALNRLQLDALVDMLRPPPGHRVRFMQFIKEQRTSQSSSDPAEQPTAAQKREWKSSVKQLSASTSRRGKDGPWSHYAVIQKDGEPLQLWVG